MLRNFFKRKANKKPAAEPSSNQITESDSFKAVTPLPGPEVLCEIDPDSMTKDEIRDHLKKLYKRHNEAAASLDKKLRDEAEKMLDAIVECRGKYVDS